jgi:hypothetical protein
VSKLGLTLSLLIVSLFTTVLAQSGSCRDGGRTLNGGGDLKGATATMSKTLAAGMWGGEHLRMDVSEGGAGLDYDCAAGVIERPIVLDGEGGFDVKGTYVPQHGGPIRRDEEANTRPARYVGRVKGNVLILTVSLADPEESVGQFTLTHGDEGRVMKCR